MVDSTQRTGAVDRPMTAILAFIGRAGRGIRWYVTTLMGDSAYATYVAHQRRQHPDEEPMTERQFWRQKMDDQDRNPGARCC
ncbi:YbdD/YjiX family protein [Microbacterium sp. GXF0217]